jgi:hypothetical protein
VDNLCSADAEGAAEALDQRGAGGNRRISADWLIRAPSFAGRRFTPALRSRPPPAGRRHAAPSTMATPLAPAQKGWHGMCPAPAMPKKNRRKDSKDSAAKRTLNPPDGGTERPSGAMSFPDPSGLVDRGDPDDKTGQFTGRGTPGLQKK